RLRPLSRALTNACWQRPLNTSTEIRLTRLCTQRCRQCRVYERTTEPPTLDLPTFRLILSRLEEYGAYIGFLSGGEPTLVPELPEMLPLAAQTFAVSTTLVTGLYNRTSTIERVGRLALELGVNIQTSLDGLGSVGDNLRGVPDFSQTVLRHMALLSSWKGRSSSLLYVNVVLSAVNLSQVPEIVQRAADLGWKVTLGLYHHLTETTRYDDELRLRPSPQLQEVVERLVDCPHILNLPSFLRGIVPFLEKGAFPICPFVDDALLSTRLTLMENGDVHLCWGGPVGNVLKSRLVEIMEGKSYRRRLAEYRICGGCWTTCYTQRYLLVHPRNGRELRENVQRVLHLRTAVRR
ncbi:MAG: radical SAM protein, partial [candidate division KSB1 bacterium]|nr:radical SAM protein [candidate division KSB1 bacterium]